MRPPAARLLTHHRLGKACPDTPALSGSVTNPQSGQRFASSMAVLWELCELQASPEGTALLTRRPAIIHGCGLAGAARMPQSSAHRRSWGCATLSPNLSSCAGAMARGPKMHLKRLNAPKHWMLDKLGGVWAPRPSTGPHKLRECLPLIILLRNRLKYALTGKEVKYILMQRLVKVDGKARTDSTYPAGFMDIISIEKTNEYFRLLYDVRRAPPHELADPLSQEAKSLVGCCSALDRGAAKTGCWPTPSQRAPSPGPRPFLGAPRLRRRGEVQAVPREGDRQGCQGHPVHGHARRPHDPVPGPGSRANGHGQARP